jgi:ferredoxin
MCTVRFDRGFSKVVFQAARGGNLLAESLKAYPIDHHCTVGKCGRCAITVAEGLECVSEPTAAERMRLGDAVERGRRLACQTRVFGDVVIQYE